MQKAVSVCLEKYAVFTGRATRSEYWYFYLFYNILQFITLFSSSQVPMYLVVAGFVCPMTAVGVRRMHDTGKSGWFLLVPIYNLILLATPSDGENQYGR
ncbi:MAG TPA: DUF805 domain-containing protein [Candidatus Nanopelagicaceae bacterium]